MSKQRTARQKAIIKRRIFLSVCALALAAIITLIVFIVNAAVSHGGKEPSGSKSSEQSSSSEQVKKVSSATVLSTGDIMVHSTQLDGAIVSSGTGSAQYDFSAFFKETAPYYKKANLAVANLEVTFGGTDSGKYSGYPAFNTPDVLADNIKDAGISLLLTTNNHCYDTGLFGLKRTLNVLKERKIPYIGTRLAAADPNYTVKDVNGVKLGITAFTYETASQTAGRKSLNGNIIAEEANSLINSFSYEHIDDFYNEAAEMIESMRSDGADRIVFYMHWGEEYQLTQNTWQKTIAQKLCNLGVDFIIGSHPHVVQPIELLHSEDSQNTSICLYSMGNAVSNQRQEIMSPECTTGHTEDGVMFSFTVDKYSDGSTVISSVDIIPTWVDKYKGGSGYQYTIYPLENETDGSQKYGLSGSAAQKSAASYNRTKAIVGQGLTECQQTLGCGIRFGG